MHLFAAEELVTAYAIRTVTATQADWHLDRIKSVRAGLVLITTVTARCTTALQWQDLFARFYDSHLLLLLWDATR